MAYLLGFAQFPQTFPPRYVNTKTLQKEWKLSMQRWPSGGVVLGGYFASSRHGGEGRISEKNTTLRVCFWSGRRGSNSLPGIPRMAVAIRRSPASPLDLTRFAQVEAASSPVLRHIPKRIPHPVGWGILFGAGDEARTRYLDLGKVALYQMSYARKRKIDCSTRIGVCQSRTFSFSSKSL